MLAFIFEALQGPYLRPGLIGSVLLLLLYIFTSYILAYRRLRNFDGPWLASFSTIWMAAQVFKLRQGNIYREVIQKYGGPLVRIGPNDLVTDSPDVIRRMSSARSTYRRSSWYFSTKFDPHGDSLLSTMDTAAHDKLKAKLARGYAGKENPDLEGQVDEQLAKMVRLIESKYISDDGAGVFRPIDLAKTVQYFTLDTITSIGYSGAFGFLEQDKDMHDYVKIVEESLPPIILSAEIPFVQAIFLNKWFLKFFGPQKTDKNGIGKIMGVTSNIVAERYGDNATKKQDMLGSFVSHGLTQFECEQEVMLQIAAGSDTTATAIRGTMLLLTTAPSAYAKLVREIDAAVASDPALGGNKAITVDRARALPYLQAVLYEGLRLNPPFTGLLMKEVPAGGDTIEGRFVPAGVRIATSAKAVQMSEDVFGADVEVFRPERWLDCDAETRARMTATVELVFGYGRWMCAGKNIAFLEMNKIYFELLRRFDFQLVNPKNPWKEVNGNLFMHSDLWMKITPRKV